MSNACDEYFNAIEITKIADNEVREKVKKMLEQSHLKVCYGAQPRLLGPRLNPNDTNEYRDIILANTKRVINREWPLEKINERYCT